jgi:hypothetical protein
MGEEIRATKHSRNEEGQLRVQVRSTGNRSHATHFLVQI